MDYAVRMNTNGLAFQSLSFEELMSIDGGVNWWAVGAGVVLISATVAFVALAPAAAATPAGIYGAEAAARMSFGLIVGGLAAK